ncbi:MAG: porin family protein [Bacteroidota bacterium]
MNLKTALLIFVTFLGQQLFSQGIQIGAKADVTYSRIGGDGMSVGYRAGFNAGAFAEYKIDAKWSVQPELLYSQRNIKIGNFKEYFASSASEDPGQYAFLSYISVPISIKYKIIKLLTVNAGVQYSYLLYANETLLRDKSDAFKKNDFGVIAGVEYTPSRLRLYARYYRGVYDINNINNLHPWHTQQFQAGIGYILFAGKKNK